MKIDANGGVVQSIAIGSDGYLYSGPHDSTIKKWDLTTGENVLTFMGPGCQVNTPSR